MKSSKLRNLTAILSKIIEIFAWLVAALCVIALILVLTGFSLNSLENSTSLSLSIIGVGADFVATDTMPIAVTLLIVSIITCTLVAIMFRNINLIFKKRNTDSPFDESNINRIKLIGFIALATPVVRIFGNIILGFFTDIYHVDIQLGEFIMGLIILCLAQYFAYGASLEKDIDGLL